MSINQSLYNLSNYIITKPVVDNTPNPYMFPLGMTVMYIGISIMVHELGHLIAMCIRNKQLPKISFKNMEIILEDEKGESAFIVWFGVVLGLIPLMFTRQYLNQYWFMGVVLAYLVGCKYDLKKLWRLRK